MSDADHTIGEVYRAVELLREDHRAMWKVLNDIRDQTIKNGGIVIDHEGRLKTLDRDVVGLQDDRSRAIAETKEVAAAVAAAAARVAAEVVSAATRASADTLTVPLNAKTIAVVLAASGGLIAAAVTAWLRVAP